MKQYKMQKKMNIIYAYRINNAKKMMNIINIYTNSTNNIKLKK